MDFIKDDRYNSHLTRWQALRATYAGEYAVKLAGTTYLPQLSEQTDDEYLAYKERGYFYNLVKRTVQSLVGMAFRKPPTVRPAFAQEKLTREVVDARGNDVSGFTSHVLSEAILMGRVVVLVDYDVNQGKPTLSAYKTEDVWLLDRDASGQVLKVWLHEVVKRDNVLEGFVRELVLSDGSYTQNLYVLDEPYGYKGELVSTITPTMNSSVMSELPVFEVNMSWDDLGDSLIQPLTDLNLAHYRQVVEYKNLLHYCSMPTLLLTGVPNDIDKDGNSTPPKINIGASSALVLANPESNGKWIVAGSDAAAPIRNELSDIEARMSSATASIMTSAVSRETATSASSRNAANTASIISLVREVNASMSQALDVYLRWAYIATTDEASFAIPTEFSANPMDAPLLLALIAQHSAGLISTETFLDNIARGELLGESNPVEELNRIQNPIELPPSPSAKQEEANNNVVAPADINSMVDNNAL